MESACSIKVRVAFDLDMPIAMQLVRMFNSLASHPGFEVFLLSRSMDELSKAERFGYWARSEHRHLVDDKRKFCVDNKVDVLVDGHSSWLHC
jgi:hypothetical protein